MKLREIAKILTVPYSQDGFVMFYVDEESVLTLMCETYQTLIHGKFEKEQLSPDTDEYNRVVNYMTSSKYNTFLKLLDMDVLSFEPTDGEGGEDGDIIVNLSSSEISDEMYKSDI